MLIDKLPHVYFLQRNDDRESGSSSSSKRDELGCIKVRLFYHWCFLQILWRGSWDLVMTSTSEWKLPTKCIKMLPFSHVANRFDLLTLVQELSIPVNQGSSWERRAKFRSSPYDLIKSMTLHLPLLLDLFVIFNDSLLSNIFHKSAISARVKVAISKYGLSLGRRVSTSEISWLALASSSYLIIKSLLNFFNKLLHLRIIEFSFSRFT